MNAKVYLGTSARLATRNQDRLKQKAEAVAAGLALPPGIEFARFEHEGKSYALSALLTVNVDLMPHRVPDVVIRSGDRQKPGTTRR